MKRAHFVELVREVLDSLPAEFRQRIRNLVVLVEARPPRPPGVLKTFRPHRPASLLLGVFQGVPATQKSVFDVATGPDRIILYQKNIEAICRSRAEIRREVRQTVLHELGHYFGMDESQLEDV